MAKDVYSNCNTEKVAKAYTVDSQWRLKRYKLWTSHALIDTDIV